MISARIAPLRNTTFRLASDWVVKCARQRVMRVSTVLS